MSWKSGSMKFAALYSGGKDSTYSIFLAEKAGHRVEVLLTFVPQSVESYLFHYPNIHLTPLQAKAMGKKHRIYPIAERPEEEVLDKALGEIRDEVEGLVVGVVASSYQKKRVNELAAKHGLTLLTPLWAADPENLLLSLLREKFTVMVVAVAAEGLGEEWLGKILDYESVEKLFELKKKYGVNPVGEGGELETFVLDCPLFHKKIVPVQHEKIWKGSHGYLSITKAILAEKTPNP
ncbi:MAG: diphthine--ammonia ligase [Candidatus Caldarchaeum sp.]